MGAYQSAALVILRHEREASESHERTQAYLAPRQTTLSRHAWVEAILQGLDARSQRRTHLLVLAGLLVGFQGQDRHGLSGSLLRSVETALGSAVNHAVQDVHKSADDFGMTTIALTLSWTYELLSSSAQSCLDYDALLPLLTWAAFASHEGYGSGGFLAGIAREAVHPPLSLLERSDSSASFPELTELTAGPLMAGMGPLARLLARTLQEARNPSLVQDCMESLLGFSVSLASHWRSIPFSAISTSDEHAILGPETLGTTLPPLWRLLRSALFAVTIPLHSILARTLSDPRLSQPPTALVLARNALQIQRNLSFITHRLQASSFAQHKFVHLAAIDILSGSPPAAIQLLRDFAPAELSTLR